MKCSAAFFTLLLFPVLMASQRNEFEVHSNGLIYSEQTMAKLSRIVDSLNLKFKSCDFNTVFYSKHQTIGHLITIDSGDVRHAKMDIEKQITFEEFLNKYPGARVQKNILILKNKRLNYNDEMIVEIEHFDMNDDYGHRHMTTDLNFFNVDLRNTWLLINASNKSFSAFYFPSSFESVALPAPYAQMIGYSDCLIDTTSSKFKKDMEYRWVEMPANWRPLSQKKKLELLDHLRSMKVIGGCSQDRRPREHAVNIALLSAETAQWEVFLKAHLDIMNDRFERATDGSYAWAQRNTYLREIEELEIDVVDLLLGISFQIENPASNHYFGTIRRVGRALAEAENKSQVEEQILSIISDPELDDYNRAVFYFLLWNFNHYAYGPDTAEEKEKIIIARNKLPEYLRLQFKGLKD